MNKDYEIVSVSNDKILVSVQTVDLSNSFWQHLENDIRRRRIEDVIVVFDFLLKLGLANRFFFTHYKDNELQTGVMPMQLNPSIINVFDRYFSENTGLLEKSLMSSRAQHIYLEYIQQQRRRIENSKKETGY